MIVIEYAIREFVPSKPLSHGEAPNWWNSEKIYHPVSKNTAEAEPDAGVFRFVRPDGTSLTPWSLIDSSPEGHLVPATSKVKNKHQLRDATEALLSDGDFVVCAYPYSEDKRLMVGRVIGFTPKKIRIAMNSYENVQSFLKPPNNVAKIADASELVGG